MKNKNKKKQKQKKKNKKTKNEKWIGNTMKKENIIFKNEKVTEINRSKMSTLRLWEQLNDGE